MALIYCCQHGMHAAVASLRRAGFTVVDGAAAPPALAAAAAAAVERWARAERFRYPDLASHSGDTGELYREAFNRMYAFGAAALHEISPEFRLPPAVPFGPEESPSKAPARRCHLPAPSPLASTLTTASSMSTRTVACSPSSSPRRLDVAKGASACGVSRLIQGAGRTRVPPGAQCCS